MFADSQPNPLGDMRNPLDTAQRILRIVVAGASIRAAERRRYALPEVENGNVFP